VRAMDNGLGADLCAALGRSSSSVTLVAPFIKCSALKRLLEAIPASVPVSIITRWRPLEIAMGVSDLEVMDQCLARKCSRLLLLNSLHAKYYRADESVFVGSANLTGTGLGWSRSPNIEILHQLHNDEGWRRFELRLFETAIPVTEKLRQAVKLAAADLPELSAVRSADATLPASLDTPGQSTGEGRWLPRSRFPEAIRDCYLGRQSMVTQAAMLAAQADIAALALPSGLSDDRFLPYLKATLLQQPWVDVLRKISRDRPRFGELRKRVRTQFSAELTDRDPTEITQTLIRWSTYFLPESFQLFVFRFTECLQSTE
jgi:hypothetical protein